MKKRLILGLHDETKRTLYSELLEIDRDVLKPAIERGLSGLIDDIFRIRPDQVLMDVNYPIPNGAGIESIKKVGRFMAELGYDVSKSLYGVTVSSERAQEATDAGYNVIANDFQFPELRN